MNDHEIIIPAAAVADTNIMAQITKAEIYMQIATAKQYPRSIRQFINDATEMCTLNEEVAASCNYGLPRGGKIIEGPSARFAELIYGAWGNSRAGARVVHEDDHFVTAQGICHDLQRNTMIAFEVKRRITNKQGKKYDDDMVGVTGNAAASVALRNAILKVVPKAFWQPIYQQARQVSMGDSKTLATRRADALAIMLKFGVAPEMILEKFELKGVEDISLEHLSTLKACALSIRDGDATAESLFALPKEPDTAKGNEAVRERIKKAAAKKAGADPQTGEITGAPVITAPVATIPTFDINAHDLKTQAGIKAAITAFGAVLEAYPAEERGGVFMQSGGSQLVSLARRAMLAPALEVFTKLGVKLPPAGESDDDIPAHMRSHASA